MKMLAACFAIGLLGCDPRYFEEMHLHTEAPASADASPPADVSASAPTAAPTSPAAAPPPAPVHTAAPAPTIEPVPSPTATATAPPPATPSGVTCTTTSRVGLCDGTATSVQADVRFWLVSYGGDPLGGMSSDSAGLAIYANQPAPAAYLTSADHVAYAGYYPEMQSATIGADGILTVSIDATRGGAGGCAIPLVHVECSGATILH